MFAESAKHVAESTYELQDGQLLQTHGASEAARGEARVQKVAAQEQQPTLERSVQRS